MKKVYLNEFTTEELKNRFDKGEIDSAITIFGSCESHGPHLPLGPDLFVPEAVARRAAQRLSRTIVVPGVPFGTSAHYNGTPMAINIRFETVIAIAEDMFESLIQYGIKHILSSMVTTEIFRRWISHSGMSKRVIKMWFLRSCRPGGPYSAAVSERISSVNGTVWGMAVRENPPLPLRCVLICAT